MRRFLPLIVLSLIASPGVSAHDNFVTNPDLPYPPGCAGDPGRNAVYFELGRKIRLLSYEPPSTRYVDVRLDAWRSTCSEPGRSVIWLRFTVDRPSERLTLRLPKAWARTADGGGYEQRLAVSPNGWGLEGDATRDRHFLVYEPGLPDSPAQKSWTFLLDGVIQDGIEGWWNVYDFESLSPAQYNQAFTLSIGYGVDGNVALINVPPTNAELHTENGMPLNGRLSGLWAIEGAADQGVTLTIADRIAPADTPSTPRGKGPLVLILQQYTFDASGNMLWLTGAGDFAQGAQAVSFPVVRVDGGAFLGDTAAQRDVVGTVRIIANGCNDLDYEYDLTAIGLGSGSRTLRRLFSLETAGYDCRDYAAKVAANR